jgi:hypothetical protein
VHPAGLKVELDKKAHKTITSDTAPANPKDGDLWYDSVGGELYVWYDSDDAGAAVGTWVQANPQPTPKAPLWKKTGTTLGAETAGDVVDIAAVPTIPDAGATNARLTGTTCKAFVAIAVSASNVLTNERHFNVASVTYRADGKYTVNFVNPMPGPYYATVVTGGNLVSKAPTGAYFPLGHLDDDAISPTTMLVPVNTAHSISGAFFSGARTNIVVFA